MKLDKKHQRADWSMRPLTADMLDYAAQDTRHLLELRDRMTASSSEWGAGLGARGVRPARGHALGGRGAGHGLPQLKGARDLTRRELAMLRELVPWRDAIARQLDRATFRVLGNEQLLDISRTQPQTREDAGRR